ncbi:hypothetical protein AU152_gp30 [Mycobacterium phage Phlei]|uniref:Uncharacterized protein n=1 Tax=Mycobacterium phage Phlei TaxID=1690684 RepID=A0A0N9BDQ3_9CAUD|nr:hypothetical protein AU152_gp30 [Mycobacterium phage Phlei]ALA48143.1 hypothetical protein [Mycobacterium phage Phlei]
MLRCDRCGYTTRDPIKTWRKFQHLRTNRSGCSQQNTEWDLCPDCFAGFKDYMEEGVGGTETSQSSPLVHRYI